MTVLHSAFIPQVPGHGSLHLLLVQALLRSQSEFDTHSGRHPVYGSPKYSGKHEHAPIPFRSLQIAFAPHGEGLQGFGGGSGISVMHVFIINTHNRERPQLIINIVLQSLFIWKMEVNYLLHIFMV